MTNTELVRLQFNNGLRNDLTLVDAGSLPRASSTDPSLSGSVPHEDLLEHPARRRLVTGSSALG